MGSPPYEVVDSIDDIPSLRCPYCDEAIGRAELGGLQEGPYLIWFHDADDCGAVLGVGHA